MGGAAAAVCLNMLTTHGAYPKLEPNYPFYAYKYNPPR